MHDISPPVLRHLFTLHATLAAPLDAGDGPLGRRTLNSVSEGQFSGARLKGHVNPGTGDWMLTRSGIRVVDARIVLVTDDGALIHMRYGGRIRFDDADLSALASGRTRHLVDPSRYYFRTTPVFETGAPNYLWLNGIVAVGTGRLIEGGVSYEVFEVT
ncbi:MAG: DUF3237 domain-containing protein [Acidovorax sp.]|uniref:DUF3237 domain-containing protein n=1 Tax=Acidovorax sp. TaxID=1872122 RepID=UPI0039E50ED0